MSNFRPEQFGALYPNPHFWIFTFSIYWNSGYCFSRALIGYSKLQYPVLFTDSPSAPLSVWRQTRVSYEQNGFQVCCHNKQRKFLKKSNKLFLKYLRKVTKFGLEALRGKTLSVWLKLLLFTLISQLSRHVIGCLSVKKCVEIYLWNDSWVQTFHTSQVGKVSWFLQSWKGLEFYELSWNVLEFNLRPWKVLDSELY